MQIIKINMVPSGVSPMAFASQYDDERLIRFVLYSGEGEYILSSNETVHAEITKPDGTLVSIPMTNDRTAISDLVLNSEDCDQAGICSGEVVITDTYGHVTGSLNFILNIEADPYGSDVTTSTATGNPCTFTTDLADALVSLTADIVCGGGGGTPSSPIPLVGHSELNLTRCGKNLFDDACLGYYTEEITLPAGTYYFKGFISTTGTDQQNTRFYWLDDTNTWQIITASGSFDNGAITWNGSAFGWESGTFYATVTLTKPETFRMSCSATTANTRRVGIFLTNVDTFVPYNGQTFTVAFGQTVYGGVYDKSGRLTIEPDTKITLDGTENWTLRELGANSATFVVNGFKNNVKNELNQICSHFTFNGDAYLLEHINTFVQGESGNLFIQVDKNIADNANDFKTWLATQYANGTPVEYTYNSTATPIVIDVPSISVFAENGVNNIVSDCLGDVSVTYIKKV